MHRIEIADADAAIARPQPVEEADLVWSASTITSWDGYHFQVLQYRLDEDGQRTVDVDDDGKEWAALEWDEAATAAAYYAWDAEHPYVPEENARAGTAARKA